MIITFCNRKLSKKRTLNLSKILRIFIKKNVEALNQLQNQWDIKQ